MAVKPVSRVDKPATSSIHLRRSSRLSKLPKPLLGEELPPEHQLLSPSPSLSPKRSSSARKRKRLENVEPKTEKRPKKRRRPVKEPDQRPLEPPSDPVAHWAATSTWPEDMMQRSGRPSLQGSKRKSSSTHHSDKQQRLEQNGIHMKRSMLLLAESKRYCTELLEGNHAPASCPCYPIDKIDDILDRVGRLNEPRLQRDVMPWVVPSAENLFFSGDTSLEYLGEEINAEWIRCEPMGLTRPKPDFTVGLRRSAFTVAELEKLENYGSLRSPFYFTPDLSFPFLMCEAKTGRVGLDHADTQNVHSASIAVRAILDLYVATFGRQHDKTRELLGQVLVFTVSHNNRIANLYGHYAVEQGSGDLSNSEGTSGEFQYFRYDIAMCSLDLYDGREKFKAYNFVRNVYDKFAPLHKERILEAVRYMQQPEPRTGLSFSASDLALAEADSQDSHTRTILNSDGFRTPSEPASASQRRETSRLKGQLDDVLQQLSEQRKESKEQMEQQRKESKEKEEKMERLMEQQRKESKEKEEKMERLMEQQRKESKEKEEKLDRLMEQQRDQLSRLMGMMSKPQGSKSAD